MLSRQQALSLHVATRPIGTTSVDSALAPTASQELPEWHCLAEPSSALQLLVFCWSLEHVHTILDFEYGRNENRAQGFP